MDSNKTSDSSSPRITDINNVFPALVECFVVILLGYASGRFGLISSSQGKGIGNFVSHFALPALLFKSMVELDFFSVNWKFLAAILIAKGIVFASVVAFTIMLGKPQKYGKAGIFAIFCTQSNDFAIGFPLMKALYKNSMPQFLDYIYLLAPISLVLLNPIGFVLLEFNKNMGNKSHTNKLKLASAIIKGVVTNPIVFMTFIGIMGNFILKQKVPTILDGFLSVLASSFFASALFFLGLKMVGNMKKQMGYAIIVPLLLIFAKLLFLPLLAREFIQILDVGGTNQTLTDAWSMFGFLYGTIPTAPTVIIYASKFGMEEEMIATSMVIGTFLSAPMLYTSARMIAIKYTSSVHNHYHSLIEATVNDACGVSIPCGLWVIAMFILSRRRKLFPQKYTLWLVISQVTFSCVALLSTVKSSFKYWHVLSFSLVSFTCLLCRCWTAMVAFSLYLVRCKSGLKKTWQTWIYFYAFGLSIFLTGIKLCFVNLNQPEDDDQPYISYTQNQRPVIVVQTLALILSLIIIIWSLIRLQRCDKFCKCPLHLKGPLSSQSNPGSVECSSDRCHRCKELENQKAEPEQHCSSLSNNEICCANIQSTNNVLDIESLDESTCLLASRENISEFVNTADGLNDQDQVIFNEYYEGDKHQLVQHVIMILILAFSFCVGIFMCIWYLTSEPRHSGLFIAMRVLDVIMLFGQGFISFTCFGMDKQLIIIPFLKRFRRFFYGVEEVMLSRLDDLSPEDVHLCEQFTKHHKHKCKSDLVSNRRYHLRMYRNVFCGDQFVDWLIELGLADDRVAATSYGNSLLRGRVIEHVIKEHFFYDLPYFYQFCVDR